MAKPPRWRIKIEHLMACNCNWGCPCSFNAPPTYQTCEAALAYRIVTGKYAETPLDGLAWVLAAYWPGPLHEGQGRGVIYLDPRAGPAEREALQAIATGAAGGPIGVFMSTITEGLEVRTAPIEFEYAGKQSRFRVPGQLEVAFGPIRSPVSGSEHIVSAILTTGLLTKRESYYSAEAFSVDAAPGLSFAYPGRNAIAFSHTWRGP